MGALWQPEAASEARTHETPLEPGLGILNLELRVHLTGREMLSRLEIACQADATVPLPRVLLKLLDDVVDINN